MRYASTTALNTEFQSVLTRYCLGRIIHKYIYSNLRILAFQILLLLLKSMGIYSVNKGQETRSSWRVSQKAVILCLPCYGSVMDCHSTKDPCWIKSMPVRTLRLAVLTLQEQPSGEVSAMMKRPNVLLDSLCFILCGRSGYFFGYVILLWYSNKVLYFSCYVQV